MLDGCSKQIFKLALFINLFGQRPNVILRIVLFSCSNQSNKENIKIKKIKKNNKEVKKKMLKEYGMWTDKGRGGGGGGGERGSPDSSPTYGTVSSLE